ncbi:uncharacterized protein V6R79_023220 [Siganus canaliculatus]
MDTLLRLCFALLAVTNTVTGNVDPDAPTVAKAEQTVFLLFSPRCTADTQVEETIHNMTIAMLVVVSVGMLMLIGLVIGLLVMLCLYKGRDTDSAASVYSTHQLNGSTGKPSSEENTATNMRSWVHTVEI